MNRILGFAALSRRAVIAIAVVLVLAGPSVLGQPVGGEISVTRSVHQPIDWALRTVPEDDPTGQQVPGGVEGTDVSTGCQASYLSIVANDLVFSEDANQAGCAEALITLYPPEGTQSFSVAFQSDRRISAGPAAAAAGGTPNAEQEIRVYNKGQSTPTEKETIYEANRIGSTFNPFRFQYKIINDPIVGFWFADLGQDASSGSSVSNNHGLAATIKGAEIVYQGVPITHTIADVGTLTGEANAIGRTASLAQGPREDIVIVLPLGTELKTIGSGAKGNTQVPTNQWTTDVSNVGTTVTIFAPVAARELVIAYSASTASVQSTAVGIFGAATILMFIPLSVNSFLPLMRKRFNVEEIK